MNEPEDDKLDRLPAIVALAMGSESHTVGPRPDLDELWDFTHGDVSSTRREEILMHLADDAELFNQWRSLQISINEFSELSAVEALSSISHESGDSNKSSKASLPEFCLRRLFRFPVQQPWITAGFVATIAILLVFTTSAPPPAQPRDFWVDWSQPISTTTDSVDASVQADLDALAAGASSQLSELNYVPASPSGQVLPSGVPECTGNEQSCTARRDALFKLGSMAIEQLHYCLNESLQITLEQIDPSSVARAIIDQGNPELLIAPLTQWITAQDQVAVCEAAANLIGLALTNE